MYYGFRVKRIVFKALIICFREVLDFSCSVFSFYNPVTWSPQSKNQLLILGCLNEPRQCFQLLSNVSYEFENIRFQKMSDFLNIASILSFKLLAYCQ